MADRNKELEEKRDYWRAICDRQATSGLSIARFCREEGVPAWKFHYWKRRLAESASSSREPIFRELRIEENAAAEAPIEVAFPGGAIVRLRTGFDEEALRRAARVLGGDAPPC